MVEYSTVIIVSVILIFAVVIVFWIWLELTFKYRVRIKELVKGRKIIKDHKAKEYQDKDGVIWWRISGERKKNRKLLIAPPEEAIEINKRGKKCAECYRTETGDIIWIKDTGEVKEFPTSLWDNIPESISSIEDSTIKRDKITKWKKKVKDDWQAEHGVIASYDPVTTKQRMIYLHNLRKAEERKGWDWKAQILPMFSLGALALVIIGLFIFWGDITLPAREANQQMITAQETNKEILIILRDIKVGQQRIDDKVNQIGAPD